MKIYKVASLISVLFFSVIFSAFSKESKVRCLKGIEINKISLRYDTLLLIPGSSHKIGLVVFTKDKGILRTTGFLKGTLYWSNFKVEQEDAKYFLGHLYLSKSFDVYYIPFKITVKSQPEKVFYDTLWLNKEKWIKLYTTNSFKKVPGAKVKFGMEVCFDNNSILNYPTATKLKKIMPAYEVLAKGVNYKNGEFSISNNIFDYPDHHPGILVQLNRDKEVYDFIEIEMDYKDQFSLYGSGNSGMWAFSGSSGSSGSTGGSGNPGEDGRNGDDGGYGHDIDIYTDIYYDSILNCNLIKVYTEDLTLNQSQHFLINPTGGSMRINASGGNGGHGGSAGNGGNGGSGYKGEFYYYEVKDIIVNKDTAGKEIRTEITRQIKGQRRGGDGGFGGPGGYGGMGGNGGNGGYLVFNYTPAMKNYLQLFKVDVSGGFGGSGGSRGNGGEGGEGGEGNPRGRKGAKGQDGLDGPNGYFGLAGKIEYKQVDTIPW